MPHVGNALSHYAHHVFAQPGARLVKARRVQEHDLPVLAVDHAHDLGARGLRFAGDDGDLLAHELIHDAGLADVRTADDRHKTRMKCFSFCHQILYCIGLITVCDDGICSEDSYR